MESEQRLADHDHPLVREIAERLTRGEVSPRGKVERLFYYVRDEIRFGFPKEGDLMKASETIRLGMGQCNTKGTLFLALCRAAGIPARIHFSLIKKEIQRGLFTRIGYALMPSLLSHSWVEVEIDGNWQRLDSYINDLAFYTAGKKALREKGWDTGYSISCSSGASSADFQIEDQGFVQMDAVVSDQGVWDDPSDYYRTDTYRNRLNPIKRLLYRFIIHRVNDRVERMRSKSCLEQDDHDKK
ncbi:MAG: transglutaminase family protein [Deltaproteobacteria bacterium]|nr:transglutaminase family protein [Deltaproteobacteria bacterium]